MRYYFSRRIGQFVNELTGEYIPDNSFTGNAIEWYEKMMLFFIEKSQNYFETQELLQGTASQALFTLHELTSFYSPMLDNNGSYNTHGKINNQYEITLDVNQAINLVLINSPSTDEKLEFEIVYINIS